MAPLMQPGWDVLVIARPAIVEADYDDTGRRRSAGQLIQRAGWWEEGDA